MLCHHEMSPCLTTMHFQADETDAMKDEAPMSLNVFEPRAVDPGSKRWRNQGSQERTSEGGQLGAEASTFEAAPVLM